MSRDERAPAVPDEPAVTARRTRGATAILRRGAVAFGRFWWDFLVGETPELLVGSVVAVGAAALLVHSGAVRAVVIGALRPGRGHSGRVGPPGPGESAAAIGAREPILV